MKCQAKRKPKEHVVKKDMKLVGVRKEDTEDRVR